MEIWDLQLQILFFRKGKVITTVISEDSKKDFSENENLKVEVVNLANEAETTSFTQYTI